MIPMAFSSVLTVLTTAFVAQANIPSVAKIKSIAVMPLKHRGTATQDLSDILGDVLLYAVQSQEGGYRVVGKSDIDAMLGLEKMKDAAGCDQTSCAVELAGALGVDSIITGSIGNLGDKYILSLAWISQKDGTALRRLSQNLGTDQGTFDKAVYQAVQGLFGGAAPASVANNAPSDGKLGVRIAELDAALQQQFNLPSDHYALVRRVVPDSIAARSGVQIGDILISLNDADVLSASAFAASAKLMPAGSAIKLKVLRPSTGETLTLELTKP